MIRCCLCRKAEHTNPDLDRHYGLEPTDIPGSGYRCIDHAACRQRVRAVVAAHVGLGEVCE